MVINRLTYPSRILAIREFVQNGEQRRLINLHRNLLEVIEKQDLAMISPVIEEHYQYWQHVIV
jgi:DNA-binding GntR family transcriptional regulator